MLTIYGTVMSRTLRNLWFLEELGVEYEQIPIKQFTDSHSDAFKKINPNGKVPTLDDNGFILTESLAINLYLADAHGGEQWKVSTQERAQILQWSFWGLSELESTLVNVARERVLKPKDEQDDAFVRAQLESLTAPLDVLEAHLKARGHLVGDKISVGDINLAGILFLAVVAGEKFDRFESVTRWLTGCLSRDAFERARKCH